MVGKISQGQIYGINSSCSKIEHFLLGILGRSMTCHVLMMKTKIDTHLGVLHHGVFITKHVISNMNRNDPTCPTLKVVSQNFSAFKDLRSSFMCYAFLSMFCFVTTSKFCQLGVNAVNFKHFPRLNLGTCLPC